MGEAARMNISTALYQSDLYGSQSLFWAGFKGLCSTEKDSLVWCHKIKLFGQNFKHITWLKPSVQWSVTAAAPEQQGQEGWSELRDETNAGKHTEVQAVCSLVQSARDMKLGLQFHFQPM